MAYRKVRPMPHEKVARNEAMIRYAHEHPNATVEEIGQEFGVSGSRVSQIICRERKKTAAV